ncbi:RIP metalloprotease RseP [Candidatus Falkowbacteria bacterium]|nr:RIP metalloprotease RseP [Candidatus Falkowbacteria bacterium]MBT6574575.1 RIP metalloprotease RseP [Candidatus Falkowbacteria bacterium]MBT7348487.1 RIP metalloprotease RseP [Candidatus Falkowbacteria bacterium]
MFTLIVFIIILGVMVFFHELGHFWTARKLGVKCDEFGFGFPPRIFGWRKVNGKRKFFWGNKATEEIKSDDTIYSMNWIPLGGFVKIKGEDGESKADPDSFGGKKAWKRATILSAGVTMNVILAAVCLIIAFMIGAPQVIDGDLAQAHIQNPKVQIMSILEDSPAEEIGLKMGDVVLSINGEKFTEVQAVQDYIDQNEEEPLNFTIKRLDEEMEFTVSAVEIEELSEKAVGIGLAKTGTVSYPWYQSIWLGIKATIIMFVQIIVAFYTVIKNAIVGQPLGIDVAGPVGIAVMTGQVARMGFVYILQFTALLSLNLAIINFLPLPALDGGRVLFLIVEKLRGKPIKQKTEQIVHAAGFAFLMLLVVVVTGRDLLRFKDFFITLWEKITP